MLKNIKPYLISVAISLFTGFFASLLTRGYMDIYSQITKPPLAPPSILFPIVWTVLYVLMGIGAAVVYNTRSITPKGSSKALVIYALSLILNFSWSIIFFRLRAFLAAFICLLALLFSVIKTISSYMKVAPIAAYLQIPYALWVAFAGYLNLAIYILNP